MTDINEIVREISNLDEYFGSLKLPPQKMTLNLPDGTKVELVNEPQLREQIAREIEESDDSPFPCGCSYKAAAIARGGPEPNQVTKDAIEEARNRNDPR